MKTKKKKSEIQYDVCPKCGGIMDRRYYPNEAETLTQLYCSKCRRGFGPVEIA